MGIARAPSIVSQQSKIVHLPISTLISTQDKDINYLIDPSNSMSQDFQRHGPHQHHHQGIFSFPPAPDGFERRADEHCEPQILRDKMRFQGFDPVHPLVGIDHQQEPASRGTGLQPAVHETAGMLSEMFNFGGRTPDPLLVSTGDSAAAAMQLFLSNHPPPPPCRSPPPHHNQSNSTVDHMLVPPGQGFQYSISQPQFTWIPEGGVGGGAVEGQGLSLSLSSSSDNQVMFFNSNEGRAASLQGYQQLHFGYGSSSSSVYSLGAINILRNSKYTRPAQELLEEFCSVGRAHLKKAKFAAGNSSNNNPTASTSGGGCSKDLTPLSPADTMEHQKRKVKLISMLDEVERRYSHYCEQIQMVVSSFDMVMGFGAAVPYTALAQKAMSRHFRCLKDAIQAQLKNSCELLGEKDVTTSTGLSKGDTPRLKMLEQRLRKQRAFHQMGMMEQEPWRPQRGLPERSVNILRAWLFEHFLNPYPSDSDKHLLARQTGLSRSQVSNWFINARVRLWKPMVEEMYQKEAEDEEEGRENEEQANIEGDSNSTAQTPKQSPAIISTASATLTTPATLAIAKRSQINDHESDPSLVAISKMSVSSSSENQLNNRQPTHLPTPPAAAAPTTNPQGFIQTTCHVDPCNHFGTSAATVGGGGAGSCDSSAANHNENSTAGPAVIRFSTATATGAGDVSLTLGLRHGAAAAGGRNPPEKSTGFFF